MDLPTFKYHPDPIKSGSVIASEAKCRCCDQARGYIYTGSVYAEEDDLDDAICPWCIADGSAAKKFDATFNDTNDLLEANIDEKIADIIATRTPGYSSWQQETWLSCCDDAAAFIMPAGIKEIREYDYSQEGNIMSHIVYDMQISGSAATRLLDALDKDKGPTVYVFKCLHCNKHLFHIDYA